MSTDLDVTAGDAGNPSAAQLADADRLIDWDLAVNTVRALGAGGPALSAAQAQDLVHELRAAAAASTGHVARATGLQAVPGERVYVVDRVGWAAANAASFRSLLAPALSQSLQRKGAPAGLGVARKVTGAELGSVLAFLGTKVLGQYDIGGGPQGITAPGRLLLVAPNVVHIERELALDPHDFRLWVCLHEETHRVQFAANPWLREHLIASTRGLSSALLGDPKATVDRLLQALRRLPDVATGRDGFTVLDLVQSPRQREEMARLTAVMSLLEGHADVVMDMVGPDVIPSVVTIRAKFTKRRKGRGVFDQLVRRLLGLDAKMRQYADGAGFVQGVVDKVGMEGFNRVWAGPETLPRPEEIHAPTQWIDRVLS